MLAGEGVHLGTSERRHLPFGLGAHREVTAAGREVSPSGRYPSEGSSARLSGRGWSGASGAGVERGADRFRLSLGSAMMPWDRCTIIGRGPTPGSGSSVCSREADFKSGFANSSYSCVASGVTVTLRILRFTAVDGGHRAADGRREGMRSLALLAETAAYRLSPYRPPLTNSRSHA